MGGFQEHGHIVCNMKSTSQVGLILFFIYCVLYLGFTLINAFVPTWMEAKPFLGLNLSVTYGFCLIFAALILALVYGLIARSTCTQATSDVSDKSQDAAR
jgi:uncharacterized membrane protein (DUF485 family)